MKTEQNTQIQPTPVFLDKLCQEENEGPRNHGISLLDQAPVGYCILNEKGMFLEINAAALTLLKATKNQLTQKSISRFIFPEDQDAYYHHRRKLLETSKPQTYELRMVATDGTIFWAMCAVTVILEADSALRYHLVITDISEHKKMQEAQATRALDNRVKKSEKAHSVTRLAGGVAHSFNNMLGVISGYIEMALQQVAEDQPLHADLFIIKMAADRCAELTRQLLAFAGRQCVTPQIVDLNPAIGNQVRSLRQTLPAGIRLHWQPGEKLWPVKVDPSQFEQILNHLCANAAEAITASGAITVQIQNSRVEEASTSGHRWLEPGEYVQLTVRDDGCGIATQNIDHVFEPFFTTKKNGSGLGLGLATVCELVKQNRGHIEVSTVPGQGTLFTVFLPRYKEKQQETPSGPGEAPMTLSVITAKETILLVDDEPIILEMVARLLEQRGYNILKAHSAEEALGIIDDFPGNVDLLLTDVVLPGMNGDDLVRHLLPRYPALKCLFMSGYGVDVVNANDLFNEGIHFIQKPFAINDVLDSIHKVMIGQ